MARETVFGFKRNDADQLLRLINGNGPPVSQERPTSDGNRIYQFQLTSDLSGGFATATIKYMDGTATGFTDQSVRDPLFIFSDLTMGAIGICKWQDGFFWILQAACP